MTLFLKAFEFCKECNADVYLMVQLHQNGQIILLNSNDRWPLSREELVGFTLRTIKIPIAQLF